MVLSAGIRYHLVKRARQRERELGDELASVKEFQDPGGVGCRGRGLVVLERRAAVDYRGTHF